MGGGAYLAGHDLDVHAPLAAALAQQRLLLRLGLLDGSLPAGAMHFSEPRTPQQTALLETEQMSGSEQPSVSFFSHHPAMPPLLGVPSSKVHGWLV